MTNNVVADNTATVPSVDKVLTNSVADANSSESRVRRDPPVSDSKSIESESILKLSNWDRKTVPEQLTVKANKYYQSNEVFGGIDSDVTSVSQPKLPLTFKGLMEFEVINVPKNKGSLKMAFREKEQVDRLNFYGLAVFEDKEGYLYTASLESRESSKNDLLLTSIGPAIDRNPLKQELPLKQRHLKLDSTNYITSYLANSNKLVVIPYPYAMDQIYVQEGSSVLSASFEQLDTGRQYSSLDEILSETDNQWKSVNPESVQ